MYTLVQTVLDDNSIILLNFADIFFCEWLDFYLLKMTQNKSKMYSKSTSF